MNSEEILEFLESYKNLDELCRQILSSDRGVSQYIDEMSHEVLGSYMVDGWEKDYKQLKRMRWIRNCLVHQTNSFSDNLFDTEDIEWLHNFYFRIMECRDPFSLLNNSQKKYKETAKQKNEKTQEKYFSSKESYSFQNEDLTPDNNAILLFKGILFAIVAIVILWYYMQ